MLHSSILLDKEQPSTKDMTTSQVRAVHRHTFPDIGGREEGIAEFALSLVFW